MKLTEADKKHIKFGIPVDATNYKSVLPARWWQTFEQMSKKHKELFYFPGLWTEFTELPIRKKQKISIDLTAPLQ
jgi:hypothetical protein